MWEKELKIIEGLGKLYPEFKNSYGVTIAYEGFQRDFGDIGWWVCMLSVYHLKQRVPSLEYFLKHNTVIAWDWYTNHFELYFGVD